MYQLFSAENSIFSGKVRAYLRFKHDQGDLGPGYEDILVTPELIEGLLVGRSGSPALPQLETHDGVWLQDSSEIIDHCERVHSRVAVVPDAATRPRQRLAAYLIELLAAFTDFVYQSDAAIHYSIASVCALFYPAASALFLYCLPAFRTAAEEAATGTWDI
jgi:hypothetical protein